MAESQDPCAECIDLATQTVEIVVRGETLLKDLCDRHAGELLSGGRPLRCMAIPSRRRRPQTK